jgi:hypothetical protein
VTMGPIALFDKSFLQSLTVDESVWFDHFFATAISPFFWVETLADLGKSKEGQRTPEDEVRIIADKFPELGGTPFAFHVDAALSNLAGFSVPMTGQILVAGGRPVRARGRNAIVWEQSMEAKAFSRWQQGEFSDLEHRFASQWRAALLSLPLDEVAKRFQALGIGGDSSRTLPDAKAAADRVVDDGSKSEDLIRLSLMFLGASPAQGSSILSRWRAAGSPSIGSYAPYATFVLRVEIFFQIAVAAGLISYARPSIRIDIAYLFYLPFCMVFVSSDRLHARCAPLFIRADQEFVWGLMLKQDLSRINAHFDRLPLETKEKGIFACAPNPPTDCDSLVARLWDRFLRPWRDRQLEAPEVKPDTNATLIDELNSLTDAPDLPPEQVDFDVQNPDALALERLVRKRKGGWWQLPKDLPEESSS